MEINPLSRVSPMVPVDPAPQPLDALGATGDLVAAVRALNKSEMLGENRQLLFTLDRDTQQPVLQILSRKTGEVLEQIPPEQVLRIMAGLGQQRKGERDK